MTVRIVPVEEYLTEDQVLERWPRLTRAELARARRANPPLIAHYAFRGGACFTPAQVQEYIDRTYLRAYPCPGESPTTAAPDSRSGNITSTTPIPTAAESGTPAGMTPVLGASAAEALKQQILSRPRSRSQRSSPPRRKAAKAPPLKLVKS